MNDDDDGSVGVAVRRHDVTLTTTTMQLTVDTITVIRWANRHLQPMYTVHDLDEATWRDGHLFLALAHAVSGTDNERMDDTSAEARIFHGQQIVEAAVGVDAAPPRDAPVPVYVAHLCRLFPAPNHEARSVLQGQNAWMDAEQADAVLCAIQNARQQVQHLIFRPTASASTRTPAAATSDSPPSHDRAALHWHDQLDTLEQLLDGANDEMHRFRAWADTLDNSDKECRAMIQHVEQAYATLQEYLARDQPILAVYRKRFVFHQAIAPIYEALDWIQAQMLKTTTTDSGIQQLETRLEHASELLDDVMARYNSQHDENDENAENEPSHGTEMDAPITSEVGVLRTKFVLVRSWVHDVRVWFVEAQRIGQWLDARIHDIESDPVPDALQETDISITRDDVQQRIAIHAELEAHVDQFDKQDMSRLRGHVKALTQTSSDKELSPADTTTIEITFKTLTTLDRLMYLLRQRSYELRVLLLRLGWKSACTEALVWVSAQTQALDAFITAQARWHDQDASVTLDRTMIDTLLQFEHEISAYDAGPFTAVVNLYQELDDSARVDVPAVLERAQVHLEESFELLINRAAFARQIVEQHLAMHDFMHRSRQLIQEVGQPLALHLQSATLDLYRLAPHDLSQDQRDEASFIEENGVFHERAVQLMTVHARIPLTDARQAWNHDDNDRANAYIQATAKARNTELLLFGESLEHKLAKYRYALNWHARLETLDRHVRQWLANIADDHARAKDTVHRLDSAFGPSIDRIDEEWRTISEKGVDEEHDDDPLDRVFGHVEPSILSLDDDFGPRLADMRALHQQLVVDADERSMRPAWSKDAKDLANSPEIDVRWITAMGNELCDANDKLSETRGTWNEAREALTRAKARRLWEMAHDQAAHWLSVHDAHHQHVRHAITGILAQPAAALVGDDHSSEMDENAICELRDAWRAFESTTLPKVIDQYDHLSRLCVVPSSQLPNSLVIRQEALVRDAADAMRSKHRQLDQLQARANALTALATATRHVLDQGAQWQSEWAKRDETVSTDTMAEHLAQLTGDVDALWHDWQSATKEDDNGEEKDEALVNSGATADELHAQCLATLDALARARDAAVESQEKSTMLKTLADKLLQELDAEKQRLNDCAEMWLAGPKDNDDTTDAMMAWARQQYATSAKDVAACKQTLQRVAQDAAALLVDDHSDPMATKLALNAISSQCDDWQQAMDLVRRVLGLGKSTQDINAWLTRFEATLHDQSPDNDALKALNVKLDGFAPIIDSLQTMHNTIQSFPLPQDPDIPNPAENVDEKHHGDENSAKKTIRSWQKVAHGAFEAVQNRWDACHADLARAQTAATAASKASLIARKIQQVTTMVDDASDRLARLDRHSLCANEMGDEGDDGDEDKNVQFKALPRHVDFTLVQTQLAELHAQETKQWPPILANVQSMMDEKDADEEDPLSLQLMDALQAKVMVFGHALAARRAVVPREVALSKKIRALDDVDVLLEAMAEVVTKAAPHYRATLIDNTYYSRAELQAKRIELNAKFKYYEGAVQTALDKLDRQAQAFDKDEIAHFDNESGRRRQQHLDRIEAALEQHAHAQQERWRAIQSQTDDRRAELSKALAAAAAAASSSSSSSSSAAASLAKKSSNGNNVRTRKSSLPTRKASSSTLSPAASSLLFPDRHPHARTAISRTPSPTPTSAWSNRRTATPVMPGSAAAQKRTMSPRFRNAKSSLSLSPDAVPPLLPRSSSSSTTTATVSTASSASLGPPRFTTSTHTLDTTSSRLSPVQQFHHYNHHHHHSSHQRRKKNRYVAQSDNLLDTEIARIVNAAPYDVKVKMVPGEVGRYWFGDVKPKLVYCRVLQSRMVMVRVGGGWTELSQFLRDHALLEGAMIIPEQQRHETLHEVFLKTSKSTPVRTLSRSASTPTNASAQQQESDAIVTEPATSLKSRAANMRAGYKDGDNYIAIDHNGNQLQVKMTKFSPRKHE
ncbi:hypothetical protein BC940DRAFT_34033 [Gongronella butleri]|nr:hypothetical protein BC940DRAFT_34033 [Gongronella butleri]